MPKKNLETVYSDEEIVEIRQRVKAVIEREGGNLTDYAKAAGIPYSTFHAWYQGKYTGDIQRVTGETIVWLESREERERAAFIVPKDVPYVALPTATKFQEAMLFAMIMPEISVVAGSAGLGKTTAASHFAAQHPHVWLVTIEPCSKTTYPMLSAIAEEMEITEKIQTKLSKAIGAKVKGVEGLIIIDEAQHLESSAVDQLRSLHDKYGIGIVLMGNEKVYAKLEGEDRSVNFAQLFSRIGRRVTQAKPVARDLCMFLDAWGITDKAELQFLKGIGLKPGSLRVLSKLLKMATMMATGENEPRTIEHLHAAWQNLTVSADRPV
jgi:DNA transposition AAA+ family ATPase